MKETTSDGAYVEHEATYSGFEGMGRDDEMESAAGESEGDDGLRRAEGVVGDDVEGALVD